MKNYQKILLSMLLMAGSVASQAAPVTYAGVTSTVGNCIPFGCPDAYGPHMGFIYKNIAAFSLKAGDVIAFDTGAVNDYDLHFSLSLAATTVNGGTVANASGFTTVSQLGAGFKGDNLVGNYDIAFVATTAFNFLGGGLIIDLLNTNGVVNDQSYEQNLVQSSSAYNVLRYYAAGTAGNTAQSDGGYIGNLQITSNNVPEPGSLLLVGAAIMGLLATRRRSTARHQEAV